MKKYLGWFHRCAVGYAVLFSPFCILIGYWLSRYGEAGPGGRVPHYLFQVLMNLGFVWMLSLAYCVLALLFYEAFRESLLSRLAGFREQDERERLVTARAARATFLLTLAFQIALLVMSMTGVHLVRTPDGHGSLSIWMGLRSENLDFYARPAAPVPSGPPTSFDFRSQLLPPNVTPILLLTILVQLGGFRLFSRRRHGGDLE